MHSRKAKMSFTNRWNSAATIHVQRFLSKLRNWTKRFIVEPRESNSQIKFMIKFKRLNTEYALRELASAHRLLTIRHVTQQHFFEHCYLWKRLYLTSAADAIQETRTSFKNSSKIRRRHTHASARPSLTNNFDSPVENGRSLANPQR